MRVTIQAGFFGIQLTVTLVSVFIVWRLRNFLLPAHRLLHGLSYVQLPSDEIVSRYFSAVPTKPSSRGRSHGPSSVDIPSQAPFIPKNEATKIPLDKGKIKTPTLTNPGSLESFHSFFLLETNLLLLMMASLVFIGSQLYFAITNSSNVLTDANWGGIWLFIGAVTVSMSLMQIVVSYSLKSAEFQYSLLSSLLFIAIALFTVGPLDGQILDFNLKSAFEAAKSVGTAFITANRLDSYPIIAFRLTELNLQLTWAILASFLGVVLVYPSIRLAYLHSAALANNRKDTALVTLLNVSFLLPLLTSLLWFRPFTHDVLVAGSKLQPDEALLSTSQLAQLRIILCLLAVGARFAVLRPLVQAHLNSVTTTLKQLSGEEGRLLLVDFKLKVWPILFYVCVVTFQLLGPMLLLLYLTLAQVAWGGFGFYNNVSEPAEPPPLGAFLPASLFAPVISYFCWWVVSVQAFVSVLTVLLERIAGVVK